MYGLSPVFTYVWLLSHGIEIMSSFVGVRNMLAVSVYDQNTEPH